MTEDLQTSLAIHSIGISVAIEVVLAGLVDDSHIRVAPNTITSRYGNNLSVFTVVCDSFSAVFVPQNIANLLGHPPGISIAIDDCGHGDFAEIERNDLFDGDGIFL